MIITLTTKAKLLALSHIIVLLNDIQINEGGGVTWRKHVT